MNARAFLLVLMMGLFIAAWDGDREAQSEAIAARDQLRAEIAADFMRRRTGESAEELTGADAVLPASTFNPETPISGRPTVIRMQSSPSGIGVVPVPANLPAGSYQAVGASGELLTLIVESSPANAATEQTVWTSGGPDAGRWHFVRLTDKAAVVQ